MLIISQLIGYMTSKFVGVRLVSELNRKYRALAIVGLIVFSELALVLFAILPDDYKLLAMFLNGLPLGMVFGFVLSFLEGRITTEALAAALCASFIMSSGVVKSIGQWLIQSKSVGEFQMPMITGLIFLPPLLFSVWVLQKTPPPSALDVQARNKRSTMNKGDRWNFFAAYWPGLDDSFLSHGNRSLDCLAQAWDEECSKCICLVWPPANLKQPMVSSVFRLE